MALAQDVLQCLGIWESSPSSRVGDNDGIDGVFLEEEVAPGRELNNVVSRYSLNLHHIRELLRLIFAREKWVASVKLCHDTAETPHIDGCGVGNAQYDLWRTIEPGLDIGVDTLVLEAAAAVVNDLDSRLVWLL